MTELLYYNDPFLKKFTANIISYEKKDDKYHIMLDQTAFYPEGGGQPADRGFIGNRAVDYVYKKDNTVYHIVKKMPEKQKNIDCKIDWERRFDLMQQHTGQHLLSAMLKKLYDVNTVGFHLGDYHVTIDTDIELSKEQINKAEDKTNEFIYKNKKITVEYPSSDELNEMSLRKKPKVEKNIRIVKIEDIDITPCGGTHLRKTGEIGIISNIDYEKYKDGTRVKFLCGNRALKDYRYKNNIIAEIRDILSVKNEDICSEINRLKENLDDKDDIIKDIKGELLDYQIEDLIKNAEKMEGYRFIIKDYCDVNYSDLKSMANKLVEYENNIVIFGQKENDTSRIILAKSDNIEKLNMNSMIKEVMSILEGNGGGHEFFAQGGGTNTEKLQIAIENAYKNIKEELMSN